jgi:hypothetical protein
MYDFNIYTNEPLSYPMTDQLYQVSTHLIRKRMPFFGFAPRLPYLNGEGRRQGISPIA